MIALPPAGSAQSMRLTSRSAIQALLPRGIGLHVLRQRLPAIRGLRRPQRFVEQPRPAGRGRGAQPAGPSRTSAGVNVEPLQQPRHAVLRMGPSSSDCRPMISSSLAIEARQHHAAARQSRDHASRRRRRGNAAGGAGGDDRIRRRLRAPERRLRRQHPVAPQRQDRCSLPPAGSAARPRSGWRGSAGCAASARHIPRAPDPSACRSPACSVCIWSSKRASSAARRAA